MRKIEDHIAEGKNFKIPREFVDKIVDRLRAGDRGKIETLSTPYTKGDLFKILARR